MRHDKREGVDAAFPKDGTGKCGMTREGVDAAFPKDGTGKCGTTMEIQI